MEIKERWNDDEPTDGMHAGGFNYWINAFTISSLPDTKMHSLSVFGCDRYFQSINENTKKVLTIDQMQSHWFHNKITSLHCYNL